MGIHQAIIGGYGTNTAASFWSVPFSSIASGSNYTVSNLQAGDLVFFSTTDSLAANDPIPGWRTLISGSTNPNASAHCRKAIVDTSFTIPQSWVNSNTPDNSALIVVRSSKNTIDLMDQSALGTSTTGFVSVPSSNSGNQQIPAWITDPFALLLGFYNDDDLSSSSAPSDYTYLGLSGSSNSSLVAAYSLEASAGDTAPPNAGVAFGNPDSVSNNNDSVVVYATTEDRTVTTWSIVDSVFQDLGADGRNLTINNLQQGDFVYWTQVGDNAGNTSTESGWFSTMESGINLPSFKEQVQEVGAGVTSISVNCSFSSDAGALIVFRCSVDTILESSAYAVTTGSTGSPVVPDQHVGTLGTNLPLTSQNDCLCVVTGYLDDDTITTCTAPTGLTLAGFAAGDRDSGVYKSSLMVAYGVSLKGEAAPLAAGRAFTTDGGDDWVTSAWYVNPYDS